MPLAEDFDHTAVAGVAFYAYEPVALDDVKHGELIARLKWNPWFTAGLIDPDRLKKWARARNAGGRLDRLLARPLYGDKSMAENGKADKPSGEFFALFDELEASERRLNEAAKPLLAKTKETEQLAQQAIDTRIDRLATVQDYIKRVSGVTEQLKGDNQGPKVDPTTESVTPLPTADTSKG